MGRTIQDDIGHTLDKWVLVSLAFEERAEHSLMMCEDFIEVSENLADETFQ